MFFHQIRPALPPPEATEEEDDVDIGKKYTSNKK